MKIQIIENSIDVLIFSNNTSLDKGDINKKEIQNQVCAFLKYDINEIFEELNFLESNCFNVVKESKKYKLKIKIKILRKEEYLSILKKIKIYRKRHHESPLVSIFFAKFWMGGLMLAQI